MSTCDSEIVGQTTKDKKIIFFCLLFLFSTLPMGRPIKKEKKKRKNVRLCPLSKKEKKKELWRATKCRSCELVKRPWRVTGVSLRMGTEWREC
jgi:hypothetical protein